MSYIKYMAFFYKKKIHQGHFEKKKAAYFFFTFYGRIQIDQSNWMII